MPRKTRRRTQSSLVFAAIAIFIGSFLACALNAKLFGPQPPRPDAFVVTGASATDGKVAALRNQSALADGIIFVENVVPATQNPTVAACEGCAFVADMRCKYPYRYGPEHYFHKVMQCLLPHYGVFVQTRQAKVTGTRCFIVSVKSLMPFLVPLLGQDFHYKFIQEEESCVRELHKDVALELPKYTKNKTNNKEERIREINRADKFWLSFYPPLPIKKQMKYLQADVMRNVVGTSEKDHPIILLARRSDMRSFDPGTEEALVQMLNARTGRRVVRFTGSENMSSTMEMFAAAGGLVGFHGAGFANSVFNGQRLCVVEITTFQDADCSDKEIWRTHLNLYAKAEPAKGGNQRLWPLSINPSVVWETHLLPLRRLLARNGLEDRCSDGGMHDMDEIVKRIKWISLSEYDVARISDKIFRCLAAV